MSIIYFGSKIRFSEHFNIICLVTFALALGLHNVNNIHKLIYIFWTTFLGPSDLKTGPSADNSISNHNILCIHSYKWESKMSDNLKTRCLEVKYPVSSAWSLQPYRENELCIVKVTLNYVLEDSTLLDS